MIAKENIANFMILVSIILALVMVLWYVFGNSPTDIQVLTVLVLSPYLFTFGIYERLNNKISKVNDKISQSREDFHKELGEIKTQLGKIDSKVSRKKR